MTTDSAPRIKITYATLRNDNDELHAAFEAAVETARAGWAAHYKNLIDGAWRDGDGTFETRSPIDRDRSSGRSRRARAADVDDAIAAARARSRPGPRALAGAPGDPPRAAELISERQMVFARRHGDRGRQEPARGARRGRGVRRPHALLRADDGGQRRLRPPDGQPRRRDGPHPVGAEAARRLGGDQPVQLPDGAGRRSVGRRAGRRQHRRLQAVDASPLSAVQPRREPPSTPAFPTGVFNMVMGPGETVGAGAPGPPRHRRHRVHGLVRGRVPAVQDF